MLLSAAAQGPAITTANLSGYEVSAGDVCVVEGQPAQCGVAFLGWTGGSGAAAGGWTAAPGSGGGWMVTVDYVGSAGIGHIAFIKGGGWVLQATGAAKAGTISNGIVIWPATLGGDVGCGPGIARVAATLLATGGVGRVSACLDDTHPSTVFPPRIWGTLSQDLVGGRGFRLQREAGDSVALSWTGGTGQTGYLIARSGNGHSQVLPVGGTPLPASATRFVDPAPPVGPACYQLVPLGGIPPVPIGRSDVLCMVRNPASSSGAPENFSVGLNQTNTATFTWTAPTIGSLDGYVLAPSGGQPIAFGPTATAATHALAGPTCYVLFAVRGGAPVASTDILCGLPGLSQL